MTVLAHARRATVAIGAAALVMATATAEPAFADTTTIQRSATVEWLQQGPIDGVGGNVHVGRVQAWVPAGERTVSSVYGEMFDYTCPAGFLPDGLWLDALVQLDATCAIQDNLIIETGDLDLHVTGKLHTARLVGDLGYIHGLAVGDPGVFDVDLLWDAPGDKTVTREVFSTQPRTILVTTTREASVTGTIGSESVGTGVQATSGVVERYKMIQRD